MTPSVCVIPSRSDDEDLSKAMKTYFIYMVTTGRVVSYTGITNSLERRLWFHTNSVPRNFTKRYEVDQSVPFERFDRARDSIFRKKKSKVASRQEK